MAGVNLVGGKLRTTIRKQWFDQVEAPNLQTLTADLRLSNSCLLYTSPSPRDKRQSRMPSSA